MILCDFFAEGDPFGQPRLRPRLSRSGALGVHMPRTAEGWRLAVLLAARRAWGKAPLGGPLEVDLRFLMRRPKSHYTRSGGSARVHPHTPSRSQTATTSRSPHRTRSTACSTSTTRRSSGDGLASATRTTPSPV